MLQNLRTLQEEKGGLEAKLGQKTLALQAQVPFAIMNCNWYYYYFFHVD